MSHKNSQAKNVVLRRLARRWLFKSKEYEALVGSEWKHGDKFASRRYEGIATGLRWCGEDLLALLREEAKP